MCYMWLIDFICRLLVIWRSVLLAQDHLGLCFRYVLDEVLLLRTLVVCLPYFGENSFWTRDFTGKMLRDWGDCCD